MAQAELGAYRLVAELGAGGMGRVWRAELTRRAAGLAAGAVVAVKVVHPHLVESEGFFKRFLREAEIGRRVVHPNVVRTLDCDQVVVDGRPQSFLVMEYAEGRTLRQIEDEIGRAPEELCRHIGREVAKGLAAIHAAGAVHRDLKPENVIISPCSAPGHDPGAERHAARPRGSEGHVTHRCEHAVKVMDLGVARLTDEAIRLSQSGLFVGSVEYAAPEQFRQAGDVDARADLHALGLLLYELSTGHHPYRADDFRQVMRKVLDEKPRRAGEVNPQLSPFFEEVVSALLAKERADRPGSAADVARILDEGERSSWWLGRARSIRVETRRPLRRIRIPRETALYGREAELARLRAVFDAAKSGEGRVVLVDGEAGIGKSRLVDEFVGLLGREGEDVNFLFGSYPPGGAATASGAFSTAYREQFGEQGSAEYLPQTPVLVPAFDALLRGVPTPPGVEALSKDSLQTAFVHATRHLAAERPTIVLIDDLHFAPEEGRALFAALALAVPGHRILLIGTTRPGLVEKWLAGLDRLGAARMSLTRLGAKDLGRLLAESLRSEALAEEIGWKIARKSDGNPFFVFEILRGLRDGQFITRRDDGSWATTRIIEELEIPSSVLELVQARVADLSREERNALDVAACLGFEFDPSLVAAALGVGRIPLLQSLAHVEKAHRLVRSAGRRFVFDHHQVQEALYGGLPEMLREEYHAAIAQALEEQSGAAAKDPKDLDGALCVDLAEHLLKGAQGARALRHLDPALTHLEAGYLNDAACRLADRALAVPGLLAGGARADLLARKARRLDLFGRTDDESAVLHEAVALADADGDPALRARMRIAIGLHLWNTSHSEEALARLLEAQPLARAAGDRAAESGAAGALGLVLLHLGRYDEARAQMERQLELSCEMGDRRSESIASGNMGLAAWTRGRFVEARERLERQLALARGLGDRRSESLAMGNLGIVFSSLGRYAEAHEHVTRHLELAREIGDRRGEAMSLGNLGFASLLLGHYADARERLTAQLRLAREIGDRRTEALATGNLGSMLTRLGRFADAREHLDRRCAIERELGDRWLEGYGLQFAADLAAEEGDAAGEERLLSRALELRRDLGQSDGEAETLAARGWFLARQGREGEARADFEAALELARGESLPVAELLASAGLAALPGGDIAAALAVLAAHEERVDARTAMEVRVLLWRTTREPQHLAEAKRRLDRVVEHAPPEDRGPMVANVRLHREIAEAWASHGDAADGSRPRDG